MKIWKCMFSLATLKNRMRPVLVVVAHAILYVFILPAMYIVEPFWRIRILSFATDRMGHLAGDFFLYLARIQTNGNVPRSSHVLLGARPCNRQLLEMWKRRLPINESSITSTFWHYCKHTIRRTRFNIDPAQTSDDHFEFSLKEPRPVFTEDEERKGKQLLADLGMGPDDWFVSLHVSDNIAYTRVRYPDMSDQDVIDVRRNGHSLRDGRIEDYYKAARYIADKGGFVLRTGAAAGKDLPDLGNSRIIDYTRQHRSDFGDIYLAAKARFFLGGPSGLAQTSMVFGVPVGLASMIPLTPHAVGRRSLFIPVLLEDCKTGKQIHYKDAHEVGLYECSHEKLVESAEWFRRAGIYVHQSSPEDILDLCLDMIDQTDGSEPVADARVVQKFYRDTYTIAAKSYLYAPMIGPRFALKYRHLIEW
jgi:putative glycosyltransferase (TIGR04372 family)